MLPVNHPLYSMAVESKKGDGKPGYIPEHRLVMAHHLGRCLTPKEGVHHKNGDKLDNRIENLEIVSASTHMKSRYNDLYSYGVRDTLSMIIPMMFPRSSQGRMIP